MRIKSINLAVILLLLCSYCSSCVAKNKVLVFIKTTGWKHTSIPTGVKAIQKLGADNNFDVDTSSRSDVFTDANLKKYKALIFLSPTGTNIFTEEEKAAFKKFINKGGGFVGIHGAADCSYEWPWYNKLVGAYFKNHPETQAATVRVVNKKHPSTKILPDTFQHTDEWYNFKDFNSGVTVLMQVDESTYKGGENGTFHPIAWYHKYDGGRAFYTALGHTDENYQDALYLKHLLGGIKYAMGTK